MFVIFLQDMPGKFGGSEREREREMGYHVVVFGFFTGLLDNMAFYCQPKSVFFFFRLIQIVYRLISVSLESKKSRLTQVLVGW